MIELNEEDAIEIMLDVGFDRTMYRLMEGEAKCLIAHMEKKSPMQFAVKTSTGCEVFDLFHRDGDFKWVNGLSEKRKRMEEIEISLFEDNFSYNTCKDDIYTRHNVDIVDYIFYAPIGLIEEIFNDSCEIIPARQKEEPKTPKAENDDVRQKALIVNLYGGPGSGKSTTAAGVFHHLKRAGINVEYVTEYAKDIIWEESFNKLNNQLYVFAQQHNRMFRCANKVDVIVTDSPINLGLIYGKKYSDMMSPELETLIAAEYASMDNLNIYIERTVPYVEVGRYQSEEEAIQADEEILDMLVLNGEKVHTFNCDEVENIVNMVKHVVENRNTDVEAEEVKPAVTLPDWEISYAVKHTPSGYYATGGELLDAPLVVFTDEYKAQDLITFHYPDDADDFNIVMIKKSNYGKDTQYITMRKPKTTIAF